MYTKFATWLKSDMSKTSEHFTFHISWRTTQICTNHSTCAITAWQTPVAYNRLANASNTINCKTTQRADEVSVASAINFWVTLLYNRKFVMFFYNINCKLHIITPQQMQNFCEQRMQIATYKQHHYTMM